KTRERVHPPRRHPRRTRVAGRTVRVCLSTPRRLVVRSGSSNVRLACRFLLLVKHQPGGLARPDQGPPAAFVATPVRCDAESVVSGLEHRARRLNGQANDSVAWRLLGPHASGIDHPTGPGPEAMPLTASIVGALGCASI